MTQRIVEARRIFKATQATVFDAWTRPELLEKWWCTPGYKFESLAIDLSSGGAYRYVLVPEEGKEGPVCTMEGQFEDVVAPERLSCSWTIRAADFVEADTALHVSFAEQDGQTEVTVIHEGFKTQEGYELHELDWSIVLSNLAAMLEAESPIPA